ncbi:MAG: hypothetical protein ACXACF_11470 [Candidatus Hermodarchaeia archaeon]
MGLFKRFKKPKASVSLTIPKSTFELGDTLKGAITVSCEDEFDATGVRAELRCIEKRRPQRQRRTASATRLQENVSLQS